MTQPRQLLDQDDEPDLPDDLVQYLTGLAYKRDTAPDVLIGGADKPLDLFGGLG